MIEIALALLFIPTPHEKPALLKEEAVQWISTEEKLQENSIKLDFDFDGNAATRELLDDTPPEFDLDSEVLPQQKKGDISLDPEFRYVPSDDPTISEKLEQEKEFKLNIGVGL